MWCPKCKAEYREGFTKCSDCGLPLVNKLAPELHEEAGPAPLRNIERLITVAKFINIVDADLARAKLEGDGIKVFMADENTVRVNWLYSAAIDGVKIQVMESDAERAREILAQKPIPEHELEKENDSQACPECGSSDLRYEFFSHRFAFLSWLLMGIPLPFLKKKWTCRKCGNSWK